MNTKKTQKVNLSFCDFKFTIKGKFFYATSDKSAEKARNINDIVIIDKIVESTTIIDAVLLS